jgi:hypothetical protein
MGGAIDIHEILKSGTFDSRREPRACEAHFEKSRPCPAGATGISDQHMVLDSFERVESSPIAHGEFRFNFMVQGVTKDQAIGVRDTLDTVTRIQVGDFTVPILPPDNFDPSLIQLLTPGLPSGFLAANGALPATGNEVTNQLSQLPFSEVVLFLSEIGSQSFSDADGRRHHFSFAAAVEGAPGGAATGDRLRLTPRAPVFEFTEPIQDILGLTLRFYNPGNELRFPPDVLFGATAAANGAGLLTFTFTDPTNLVNVAVGDRIFVRGFASSDPVLNAYVGRAEGHVVGAGGFALTAPTSSTSGTGLTFRLNPDIDVTTLTPALPVATAIASASQIDVRVAKNRIRIPLCIRRIVPRLTNYALPVSG